MAKDRHDPKILEIKTKLFDKVYKFLTSSKKYQLDKHYTVQHFSENISFKGIKTNGGNTKRFVYTYPFEKRRSAGKDESIFLGFYKDHKKDFRMPKITGMETTHCRVFNPKTKNWGYSENFEILFNDEAFEKNKDKILSLFERSLEIALNNEQTLITKHFSEMDADEIKELEKYSKSDYTYDV